MRGRNPMTAYSLLFSVQRLPYITCLAVAACILTYSNYFLLIHFCFREHVITRPEVVDNTRQGVALKSLCWTSATFGFSRAIWGEFLASFIVL